MAEPITINLVTPSGKPVTITTNGHVKIVAQDHEVPQEDEMPREARAVSWFCVPSAYS